MIYNDPRIWRKTVKLITFTVDGIEYKTEEDMTWGEWVESKYNTDGYMVNAIGQIHITIKNDIYYVYRDNELNYGVYKTYKIKLGWPYCRSVIKPA